MSFRAYSSYKDSGVEWLGEVPEDWTVVRFKTIVRERDERSEEGDEELLSVSAYTGVSPRSQIVDAGDHLSRAESLVGYKRCYPDDLVMNIMLAWNRGLGVSRHTGIVSPAYCVFTPSSRIHPNFLDYLSRSNEYTTYFKSFSSGVIDSRLRLYPDAFGALYCGLPPLAEQAAIAAFLDRETAKIDALVEEQRRLIALLKEKRQAVISHAVTKGLNPDAPTKDSGIEWLGEVPAHWEAMPLKRLIDLATSGPRGWSDFITDEGAMFFQSQNIGTQMAARLAECARINVPFGPDAERSRLREEDLVICITGARTGAVAVVEGLQEDTYVNQHVCLVRPDHQKALGRYLAYCLFSEVGQKQLALAMYGLKQGLSLGDINDVVIGIPGLNEQNEIVANLDAQALVVDELEIETAKALSLLAERRAALISAAVTGKIDVRKSATILPFPIDRGRARRLIAAEIIDRSAHQATFGRTKLQKLLYLAEAHVNINELEGRYVRMPYGPLDQDMIDEIEGAAVDMGFAVDDPGNRKMVRYRPVATRGRNRGELVEWLGDDRVAKLDKLITDFADLDTRAAEAVATLYAVWNDALIDGETPSDDWIVNGFLTAWNKTKAENFDRHELPHRLGWMRRRGFIPTGSGPKTSIGGLFA